MRILDYRHPPTFIHPIFGDNSYYGTFYYLPAIAEQDELESELSSEQIQIEELPNGDNGVDDCVTEQQQRYTVEEPPENDDKDEDRRIKASPSEQDGA